MKANYTFKHLDHSESLQNYTQAGLDEASQFLLKDGMAQVYYSKHNHEYKVEITINTRERYFKAMAESFDAYEATDLCLDKISKQILKTRQINKDHKKFDLSKEGQYQHMNERFEYSFRYKKAA